VAVLLEPGLAEHFVVVVVVVPPLFVVVVVLPVTLAVRLRKALTLIEVSICAIYQSAASMRLASASTT
jgi:hypothetical protein